MNILFFSPHMYYDVHALPEALVAESLNKSNCEVYYLVCDEILNSYCLCMSNINSNSNKLVKEQICKKCKDNRDQILNEFKFNYIYLDDYLNNDDKKEIDNLLNDLDQNNIEKFEYLNFQIGKISLYEFLLNRKLNTTNLNHEEFNEFRIYVKNSLITLIAGLKIVKKINFDRLVTYNSLYSINHVFCKIADNYNIPHFTLHAGSHHKYRLTEMTIFKGLTNSIVINDHKKWEEFSLLPLSKEEIIKSYEHIVHLLEAKSPWVYSIKSKKISEIKLREKIGANKSQKILLALMASADERFAAKVIGALPEIHPSFFSSQIEWIQFLLNLAIEDKNIFIIIRVHPREFPNKREQVLSEQGKLLKQMFEKVPNNCFINFPDDNISLHDLIKITDVGLNATSTAGLELLLFGIPVVIYDKEQLFSYGKEMNIIASDIDDYKIKIYKSIKDGFDFKYIILAFRWIAFKSIAVSIDISDGYKLQNNSIINRINRKLFKIIKYSQSLQPVINRPKKLKNEKHLIYAITNDRPSHLEIINFVENNSETVEVNLIKYYFLKYINKITTRNDKIYLDKIKIMLNKL